MVAGHGVTGVTQPGLAAPAPSPAAPPWNEGAVRDVAELLSRRWVVNILGALWERPVRRSQLHALIEGVSDKSLTVALRDLTAAGYVSRRSYDGTPPRVVYRLTRSGRSMGRLLGAITKWSTEQQVAVDANHALAQLPERNRR